MFSAVWVACLVLGVARGANLEYPREGRFFRGAYTSTEILPQMVTVLVPSSCVQVEPSLPPCRNVRNMDGFPRFLGGRVEGESTKANTESQIHTTQLGWGEYLGFYAPTVTVKHVHLQTTTLPDPRTVVTFSVKGCKPSKLPMDLNLCPPEIKPTATGDSYIATTTVPSLPPQIETSPSLQPAEEPASVPIVDNTPTEQLNTF